MSLYIPPYSFLESNICKEDVEKIGDFKRLDEAIEGSLWGMLHSPKDYDVVEGMANVRLLKTKRFGSGNDALPALNIRFRIEEDWRERGFEEDIKRIEFLTIESVQAEDDEID